MGDIRVLHLCVENDALVTNGLISVCYIIEIPNFILKVYLIKFYAYYSIWYIYYMHRYISSVKHCFKINYLFLTLLIFQVEKYVIVQLYVSCVLYYTQIKIGQRMFFFWWTWKKYERFRLDLTISENLISCEKS